ncbi:DUF6879 family protein [Streptacidiphilus melanogenes]|uniref:DUF6879 family protein n=1 Tax=Streptacidiphilus melanogenes TaxID=411235 RepID=UPI0005A67FC4|nr:DUF6879 family protein [Streptacidiphilus melanogenes]
MSDLVSGDGFIDLFRRFEHTAFRLEVRRSYGILEEDEPYQRFLAGEDPGLDWFQPWLTLMRQVTSSGKRVERVRLIDAPPSDYLRFELWGTQHNLDAGEDIRYLLHDTAAGLDLPAYDYWLFDDRTIARVEFAEDDTFLGATLSEDPGDVIRHVRWRDAAWRHALTFSQYRQERTART